MRYRLMLVVVGIIGVVIVVAAVLFALVEAG